MATYFISDTHFGHKNIIKYCDRPYDSIHQMDRALIDNWNDVVNEDDTVYHLGDYSLGGSNTLNHIHHLKGRKVLVVGNHDTVFPKYKLRDIKRYLDAGFETLVPELHIKIGKHHFTLSHFPFTMDHKADVRFKEYRPKDTGQYLLHGHLHSPDKMTSEREIHVGVDAWDYKPVSEQEILDLIV